jgi:pimeloyl-ACP methyl ester carboxylesterase
VTENVTLVLHDWGGALGFHWARRHPSALRGIAYMEAIATTYKSWDEWPDVAREAFQAFRSPQGEELILRHNAFVEQVLFGMGTLRELTEQEKAEYRRPCLQPGDERQVTLSWPRQLPVEGEPAEVAAMSRTTASGSAPRLGYPSCSSTPNRVLYSARPAARVLPELAQPDRDHRPRCALHTGRLRRRDRPSHRGLAIPIELTTRTTPRPERMPTSQSPDFEAGSVPDFVLLARAETKLQLLDP